MQGKVAFFQGENLALPRKALEELLQCACLAETQTQLYHQLSQPEGLGGVVLEDSQDLGRGGKFTHRTCACSLTRLALRPFGSWTDVGGGLNRKPEEGANTSGLADS